MKKTSYEISYAVITSIGERKTNEDAYGILELPDKKYFLVCDGLGGHGDGEVASSFVVETMKQCLAEGLSVADSIMKSQNQLLEKQRQEHKESGMKTTLTCLEIKDEKAKFSYVGDSRIYWFEKNKYKLRTKDHSVPQMLVNSGAIKEKDIRHHEDRSRLLRVMGTQWNTPKYQIMDEFDIKTKSSFLLCTDGFWELIEEKEMGMCLKKSRSPKEWLSSMEQIIRQNGKGTNMDNYTAIAVFVR